MIELRGVGFSYGSKQVLHDVDLRIGAGELLGIIGPSGSGKTTLLRLLLGELAPTTGSMIRDPGQPFAPGYVPQLEAGERTFPLTVEDMVLLGAASYSASRPWFSRAERRDALDILERLGITRLRENRLSQLSGGQFQRALIGRALMSLPNLLLLDEPTSGIDLGTRQHVLELVEELRADGLTVVLTTHDLNWVAAHLPRIVCVNGTILADGAPTDVLTEDVVEHTYGARMDVISHNGRPVVVDRATVGGAWAP